jgi:catechol 2,3-dioxygenase-like lactoylglutathione lyase family enzyme
MTESKCHIAKLTYLVPDYDEAIAYFTTTLDFVLTADALQPDGKRWVIVQPKGGGCALLLARPVDDDQKAAQGRQAGGRVFLFLETDDFERDHALFTRNGVRFLEPPRHEPYGTVAVFQDHYGQRWDLIQSV